MDDIGISSCVRITAQLSTDALLRGMTSSLLRCIGHQNDAVADHKHPNVVFDWTSRGFLLITGLWTEHRFGCLTCRSEMQFNMPPPASQDITFTPARVDAPDRWWEPSTGYIHPVADVRCRQAGQSKSATACRGGGETTIISMEHPSLPHVAGGVAFCSG